jgi:hypothetical protein
VQLLLDKGSHGLPLLGRSDYKLHKGSPMTILTLLYHSFAVFTRRFCDGIEIIMNYRLSGLRNEEFCGKISVVFENGGIFYE